METCVLIPPEFALGYSKDAKLSVLSTRTLKPGMLFHPFQGNIRIDKLDMAYSVKEDDVRHRFGLYDKIISSAGGLATVRNCNWVRFLRVSDVYGPQVNVVCTKIKGEPIYEVVRSVPPHEELTVFYLLERIEDEILARIQNTIYRQTMDSIIEETPLDLSTSLMFQGSEDEEKSVSGDSHSTHSHSNESTFGDPSELSPYRGGGGEGGGVGRGRGGVGSVGGRKSSSTKPRNTRNLLPCEVCGKSFDRPSLLKRHLRIHTGEKPHVCSVCGKGFSTSSSLNTHRRIHSGEKPHQCQVCGKRFTASSNLYYHRMTHIKEKPHKCGLCAKSFPTPGDLKSHMYVHSGSWPFKCHICSRGFSKQTNLKNHLFLHTGDKPHSCDLCHKKFALACNLRAHQKTHEAEPQDECMNCGKLYLLPVNNNGTTKGLCKKCIVIEAILLDKEDASRFSLPRKQPSELSSPFRGSEEDDEEEEEDVDEDAYLEVID